MGTISTTPWQIAKSFSLDAIEHLKTIFTRANGYIGLRAATLGFSVQSGKYGCYIADTFNETPFFGAELANLPMPLDYQIKIDGKVIDLEKVNACDGTYTLNMDEGSLVMEFNIENDTK
jgi:trehalose/maltose hydrolase-like predicted phosphorylase